MDLLKHIWIVNFSELQIFLTKFTKIKHVAYPQEDFLFKWYHRTSRRLTTNQYQNYQKYVIRAYPTKFAYTTQNPKKIIRTPNQPIRTKILPKKSMFCTLKVYRSQKFVWRLPDRIRPCSHKNNRTQVKFKKPSRANEMFLGW
jgi:hypothetical protein